MRSRQRQAGVTMIELMIVVVIAAILAAVAAPSFNDFITNTRLTSTMSQFTGDLNRARGEAIKRNSWIWVCARASNTACGTDWQNGWLVCIDSNQDNACDASTADNPNPIVIHQGINANFTPLSSSSGFRFNPNGTALVAGWFNLVSGTKSRTANIAVTGNVSVSNP